MKQAYAIIQLQGKQELIKAGDQIVVDRLEELEPGKNLEITDVLFYSDDKEKKIGQPLVEKAKVTLKCLEHKKGTKIRVATYKAKSRYRKTKGHRQYQTVLEVVKIAA